MPALLSDQFVALKLDGAPPIQDQDTIAIHESFLSEVESRWKPEYIENLRTSGFGQFKKTRSGGTVLRGGELHAELEDGFYLRFVAQWVEMDITQPQVTEIREMNAGSVMFITQEFLSHVRRDESSKYTWVFVP